MKKTKILLVVNPCSGTKKIISELAGVIQLFNKHNYTVITYVTSKQGDCTDAVLYYANDVDMIVCCGGDGTYNEAITGILKSKKDIPIGLIPTGSTNDFASSLNLSSKIMTAANDIISSSAFPIDVGSFNERYFSYVASFGLFSKVSYTTPQNLKNVLGRAAYVLKGVQELSQLKPYKLKFELDNGELIEGNYIFGAISNSFKIGGLLSLSSEKVNLNDGKFELMLVHMPKDIIELTDCIVAINNKTYNSKIITFTNAKSIRITAYENMLWTLDGEKCEGSSDIELLCLNNAINVLRNDKNNKEVFA